MTSLQLATRKLKMNFKSLFLHSKHPLLTQVLFEHRWRILLCSSIFAFAACINIYLLDFLREVAQKTEGDSVIDWLPLYIGGVISLFLLSLLAHILLAFIACEIIAELRESLVIQIISTRHSKLELAGKGKLLTTLTDDVANIAESLVIAPQFIFNFFNIVLCSIYLIYLSPTAFTYFSAVLLAGVILTILISNQGNRAFEIYRELKNKYHANLHVMFDGSKEISINENRRNHFLDREIIPSIENLKTAERRHEVYWNISQNWASMFLFAGLGIAVIATRNTGTDSTALTMTYFIVITFLAGPIEFVINSISDISKALISSKAIAKLKLQEPEPIQKPPLNTIPNDWNSIHFEAVSYQAANEIADDSFVFGPISLTIKRGEIIFITGGNGSGKSTFGKLLVGLYNRNSGEIRIDEEVISERNEPEYRSLFSTVFSDYYLFSSLIDRNGLTASDEEVYPHLIRLGLIDKLKVEHGYMSTTALSQGQRKRLALLQAWLQDTPIYLFDEWTADQDPYFREEFYKDILPLMQQQGKTLIVISHDDRYFNLADRIYKFELGKLVNIDPLLELKSCSVEKPSLINSELI